MDTDGKSYEVVDRTMGRARVTMEWEVDAEYETTEGNGIRCEGWLADAEALFARCRPDDAHKTTIERVR